MRFHSTLIFLGAAATIVSTVAAFPRRLDTSLQPSKASASSGSLRSRAPFKRDTNTNTIVLVSGQDLIKELDQKLAVIVDSIEQINSAVDKAFNGVGQVTLVASAVLSDSVNDEVNTDPQLLKQFSVSISALGQAGSQGLQDIINSQTQLTTGASNITSQILEVTTFLASLGLNVDPPA